jgi:hypothetical protein
MMGLNSEKWVQEEKMGSSYHCVCWDLKKNQQGKEYG